MKRKPIGGIKEEIMTEVEEKERRGGRRRICGFDGLPQIEAQSPRMCLSVVRMDDIT